MEKKPIKRNENLVILSREHHFGLLFCWKIRKGLKTNVATERIGKYVGFFWDNHLRQHFEEEEAHLFLKVQDSECRKGLGQHQEIKSLLKRILAADAEPAHTLLNQLADKVDAHIRFEERELFPHLERTLPEEELKRIGAALEHAHTIPFKDNYPDEFWA